MAKNEEVIVRGKVRFAFTNRLNPYGDWSVGIYPDPKSMDKVKKLISEGIKNTLKRDDDGDWIAFKRPPVKEDRNGNKYNLNPPLVVDKDGRAITDSIGTGSDVALKLEVYGGKSRLGGGAQYKAARLGGVKVYNLVPYEPETMSKDKFEIKTAAGLNAAPEPEDW